MYALAWFSGVKIGAELPPSQKIAPKAVMENLKRKLCGIVATDTSTECKQERAQREGVWLVVLFNTRCSLELVHILKCFDRYRATKRINFRRSACPNAKTELHIHWNWSRWKITACLYEGKGRCVLGGSLITTKSTTTKPQEQQTKAPQKMQVDVIQLKLQWQQPLSCVLSLREKISRYFLQLFLVLLYQLKATKPPMTAAAKITLAFARKNDLTKRTNEQQQQHQQRHQQQQQNK